MKRLRITVDGIPYDVTVEEIDEPPATAVAAPVASRPAPPAPAPRAAPQAPAAPTPGAVASPLAGTVLRVDVSVGQAVAAGDTLVVLEAMKMNTSITAHRDGTVSAIDTSPGATVIEGQSLLTIS